MTPIFWMLAGFAVGGISSGILCIHALRVATALAVSSDDRDDGEPLGGDRGRTFEHLHWKRP
jgi:hypothetical protein